MDYFCFIQSVVSYVESRLKTDFDKTGFEKTTGFSLPHTRDVFKKCTRIPLAKYVLYRKISNAAFDIAHTEKSMLDIALEYGFDNYDTFTRAFKRIAGITPREFRKNRIKVGRIRLSAGVFGPGICKAGKKIHISQQDLEVMKNMKTIKKSEGSCILYGVPKVQYSYEEATPFPSSLKACLNYMGQDINYPYLMAASGASFRLRWNTTRWDGGNVDIMRIYEDPLGAFEKSFRSAGRSYRILQRKPEVTKDDFKQFIKSEIDNGRPVIALGIIGPPEACIITGYRDYCNTLLGWNFFQENPEFAKDTQIDDCGYFICNSWWENPCTIGLMSIGEECGTGSSVREILENAVAIMTIERIGDHAGGQAAFDVWVSAILDDTQFPKDAILPLLFERLMCQQDAMVMIGEGRSNAKCFMEYVAGQYPELKNECNKAAGYFKAEFPLVNKMYEHLGGWKQGEEQARKLADSVVRKEIAKLIEEAKQLDAKACELIKFIIKQI
jgi:hypothetical protein